MSNLVRYNTHTHTRTHTLTHTHTHTQALAEALRINNVLMAIDLRQNKISPHSAKCVINAFRVKPTCLPFVKIVRRSVDWFLARVLYRYPEYPMASGPWLRIREMYPIHGAVETIY